jgi:hypothetical protein
MVNKIKTILESILNRKYLFEKNRLHLNIKSILNYQYYDGYWQSYRYVEKIINTLLDDFVPNDHLSKENLKIQQKMKSEISVFVGVRKGDYTFNRKLTKHYGSFSSTYYRLAMTILAEKYAEVVFYVFSDDIEWSEKNIDWSGFNVVFREKKKQTSDFQELILMSSCKHAIIANSTFNWWAAKMISNSEKLVYCPNKWFFDDKPIDIIPPNWIRLENV